MTDWERLSRPLALTVLAVTPAELATAHEAAERGQGGRPTTSAATAWAADSTEGTPLHRTPARQLMLDEDLGGLADGAVASSSSTNTSLEQAGVSDIVSPDLGESLRRRKVPRGTWKVGAPVCALLVTQGRLDSGHPPELTGLALVHAHRPGGRQSEQWIDISNVQLLPDPHPWVRILDRLSEPERTRLDRNLQGAPDALVGSPATRLLTAVSAEAGPYIEEWVDKALRPITSVFDEAERDRLDRRATMLKVSNMVGASERQVGSDEVPNTLRSRWEGDFIKHDSRVLDKGWRRSDAPDTWFLFEKDRRRLYVFESHTRQAEQTTGGDLIYLRSRPATIVVVQYKRLVTSSLRVTDAACSIDDRFRKQVDRLIALPTAHIGDQDTEPTTPARKVAIDFRLSATCGFVKLIESRETATEGHLYRGMYLPAEYVLLLLAEAKNGALEIDMRQDRFIDAQTFVQLVSESWVGTPGPTTLDLTRKLHASGFLEDDQPHTIAEEVWR